ncbi:hypothetical protein [Stenoxybacter acetivorans]|uniref:hypothetical protein n=1 Tax=Stenoxybacter acetivorans TaxID=422441 RepID=UPI000560CF4E|nr:hypothetical protein [Stenoxybacter acetivorans]
MTIEWAFNAMYGLLSAGFWFWLNAQTRHRERLQAELNDLRKELNTVMLNYVRRDDYIRNEAVMSAKLDSIQGMISDLWKQPNRG